MSETHTVDEPSIRERTPTPSPDLYPECDPKYLSMKTPSSSQETPNARPSHLRQKVVAVIGYAVCLFTGMIPAFWMLECMHILPRTLHKTHETIYFCFREAVGIMVNGRRTLNLNHFGNLDLALKDMHVLYDGPSVLEEEWGQGQIALIPTDLPREVEHIKKNWGADYNTLYPELFNTFDVYGFPDLDRDTPYLHLYPTPERTYGHITPEQALLLKRHCGGAATGYDDTEGIGSSLTEEDLKHAGVPPKPSKGKPKSVPLKAGRQGFTRVSHGNLVFFLLDYIQKMKYRILDHPHLARTIPIEDQEYFHAVLWIEFRDWFEPTAKVAQLLAEHRQRRKMTLRSFQTQSEGVAQAEPMAPLPAPRAQTDIGLPRLSSPTGFPLSPSPPERLTDFATSGYGDSLALDSLLLEGPMLPRLSVDDMDLIASSQSSAEETTPKAPVLELPSLPTTLAIHQSGNEDPGSSTPTASTAAAPIRLLQRRSSARLAARVSQANDAGPPGSSPPDSSPRQGVQSPKRSHDDVIVDPDNDVSQPKEKKVKKAKKSTASSKSLHASTPTAKKGKRKGGT